MGDANCAHPERRLVYWRLSLAVSLSAVDNFSGRQIKTIASGQHAESSVVLGHHQAQRPDKMDLSDKSRMRFPAITARFPPRVTGQLR